MKVEIEGLFSDETINKKNALLIVATILTACLAFSQVASASIYIAPNASGDGSGSSIPNQLGPDFQGSVPNNPDADDIETITGFGDGLLELYKMDVGGPESGSFSGSYSTVFSNTPLDPKDATISYDSGPKIEVPEYLLVKDGNNDPIWYIFDISAWDGMMDLIMTGFWPDQGAISHVAIYGGENPPPPPPPLNPIPEPASALVWTLLAAGVSVTYRRRNG